MCKAITQCNNGGMGQCLMWVFLLIVWDDTQFEVESVCICRPYKY